MSLKDDRREEFKNKYEKSKEVSMLNTYYDMNGNSIEWKDFLDRIAEGKAVDVRDKDGNFVSRHMEYYPVEVNLDKTKLPLDNYVRNSDVEDLKASLINLQKEVEKTTKFFMRSSKEFKEFRKSLNELVKSDLNNPETLATKMEQVAKKADAYVALKEQDNVKITENTKPRMAVANVVAVTFRTAISQMAQLNKTVEQEKSNAKFEAERKAQIEAENKVAEENKKNATKDVNVEDLEVVETEKNFQASLENDLKEKVVDDDDEIEFVSHANEKNIDIVSK